MSTDLLVPVPDPLVGLHVHSENSFLDGYASTRAIAQRASKLGQSAVALTDHQEVGGHLMFQKDCLEFGIKPIFGMEGYFVDSVQEAREQKFKPSQFSHITLLAQNQKGLSNLWAWSSKAYTDNFYYRALAEPSMMKEYSEGLFASDGCLLTYMARAILDDDEPRAQELMGSYLDMFGENFYMELHTFQIIDPATESHIKLNADMAKMNQGKVALAQKYGVPLVVVNDCHYTEPEDWENHALVWNMSTGGNTDQTEHGRAAAHMMSSDENVKWMSLHGIPRSITEEAIKNTALIAEKCNVEIKSELKMPRLTKSDRDDLKMFLDHVEQGFTRKVVEAGLPVDLYFERMTEEVSLIAEKNFAGYFNVVANYTKHAKQVLRMLMGPGRGSAGGSLAAYLMDITELDPVKYDLLFGRFISPARKGFPDIDLDFPQSRRPEMKGYLGERFGEDCICGIGTRSKLQPRGLLKDLGRAMSIPYDDQTKMSKIIEQVKDIDTANIEIGWDEVLAEAGGDLAPWVQKYPVLFKKMGEMMGLTRQASTHAAGMLISDRPLLGDLPVRKKGDEITTQFDMYEVEELGYVKFDILGIRHLDTLQVALDFIEQRTGRVLELYKFGDAEYNDPNIWPQVDQGKTLGLFQLEAPGMTAVAKRFKPRNEREVADLISVNRPGVVRAGLLDPFLDRRSGVANAPLDHPLLESIVGKTFGIIVYQEQVLKVVQQIAGFTVDEADKVRKIMGKMLFAEMVQQQEKFVQGCLANPEFVRLAEANARKVAEKIWKSIESAGVYSFNEAHALAYALICSWEVWVKHYYPREFLTALLITDPPKINAYLREARAQGFPVLPPSINESHSKFTLAGDNIRFGLSSVKKVGASAVEEIRKHAPFTSLADVVERCSSKANKGVLENLIKIGAMDEFIPEGVGIKGRADLLRELYKIKKIKEAEWPEILDFSKENVVYDMEQELVGSFITVDPIGRFLPVLQDICLQTPQQLDEARVGEVLTIGGQLTGYKKHKTKAKQLEMAFIELTYNDEIFPTTVFPDTYARVKMYLKIGAPMVCRVVGLEQGTHLTELQRLDFL